MWNMKGQSKSLECGHIMIMWDNEKSIHEITHATRHVKKLPKVNDPYGKLFLFWKELKKFYFKRRCPLIDDIHYLIDKSRQK